jgi:hypothetical protein
MATGKVVFTVLELAAAPPRERRLMELVMAICDGGTDDLVASLALTLVLDVMLNRTSNMDAVNVWVEAAAAALREGAQRSVESLQ